MRKKEQHPKPHKDGEGKPLASPVCYMDEFPEYFEGESVQHSDIETDSQLQKDTPPLLEP